MKKNFDIQQFINSVLTGNKEQDPIKKEKKSSVPKIVKIGSAVLVSAAVLTGAGVATDAIIKDTTTPVSTQTPETGEIALKPYGGTNYYTCDAAYALTTARQTLDKVEKILTSADGVTPVGTNSGDFFPDYFDEYMLAGMAYTESTFRVCDQNGKPVESKDGALGMMQILPQTVEDVNAWLKNTMEVDIQYSVEDLSDPAKSMEIATFSLIQICKNHGKQNCNNPLYPHLNEEFSVPRQQEIILAIYNNGYGNMLNYVKDGTVFEYLSEGSNTNYVNSVLAQAKRLKQLYPQYEIQQ